MNLYKQLVRPILFRLDPERAHHVTFSLINIASPFLKWIYSRHSNCQPEEAVELFGLNFKHRVGLAAGLDKDGVAYKALAGLGFSFLELGTVTPKPQSGNPRPRLFRLVKDHAMINRMGFNNLGADALAKRLKIRPHGLIIGGNIGKNTNTPNAQAKYDYLACFKSLYGLVDYFVVNVSCPNIQDLKELQDTESLSEILTLLGDYRAKQRKSIPILLKVSPDLNEFQLKELSDLVVSSGVDGLIATNTTTSRNHLTLSEQKINSLGSGGLSGSPLKSKSIQAIRYLRSVLPQDFPIIASGGILTGQDAAEAIEAGAQLVQIYTGFIYEGPSLLSSARREIKNQVRHARPEERKPKN